MRQQFHEIERPLSSSELPASTDDHHHELRLRLLPAAIVKPTWQRGDTDR
jgi:hypothetical protein